MLDISEAAMDISRFTDGGIMPVLFNHDRDQPIAAVKRIWIEGNKAKAEIVFDDDEDSIKIMNKVASGSVRGTSVGYRVQNYEVVQLGSTSADGITGPAYIARKWEVLEFSIVTVPADPSVGAGRSLALDNGRNDNMDNNENPNATVVEDQNRSVTPPASASPTPAPAAAPVVPAAPAAAANPNRADDSVRCLEIIGLCRDLHIDDAERDEFIKNKTTMADVRKAVLEKMRKQNPGTSTRTSEVVVGENDEDKFRAAIVDGQLLRHQVINTKAAEGSDRFRFMRMRDIAVEVLSHEGTANARYLSPNEVWKRAMTSSSAFPIILANIANKAWGKSIPEAETTYQLFTSTGNLSDFKEESIVQIGAAEMPTKLPENGEFKNVKFKEGSATVKLETYGEGFTYTRQMFYNDDMRLLTRLPTMMNLAFQRRINYLAYMALIGGNYKTTNYTLAATGGVPSKDTFKEMRRFMKKQTDISGKTTLNLTPKYIIAPTNFETDLDILLNSGSDPSGANSGVKNPFNGKFTAICDATLDNVGGEDAWYMSTNPAAVDGIEIDYLDGIQTPTMETNMDPDRLGWNMHWYLDLAVKMLDTTGFVKNAGK